MYGLTKPCETNRVPIIDILSLISLDMVFSLLSKGRLLGKCEIDNPQAFITFLLWVNPSKENDAVTCLNQVETICEL